jgi:5'-nucleotidase
LRQHLTIGLCVALATTAQAAAPTRWLELIATTDWHGHVESAPLFGGLLAIERREHPGRVLLVDGGDLFTGTLESDIGEGAVVIRAMNALGYDAAAVGNHDFDFGPVGPQAVPRDKGDDPRGALKARLGEAKFPLLTANVVEADGKPLAGTKPFVLRTVDGVKIGIVGGTTESLPHTTILPNLVGLKVLPLAASVESAAKAARAAGAQVVIAVVHAGDECPRRSEALSDAQPGDLQGCTTHGELFALAHVLARGKSVNAIFGGHTHKPVSAVVDGLPVAQPDARGLAYVTMGLEVDAAGAPTGHFRIEPEVPVREGAFHGQKVVPDEKVAAAIAPDVARAAELRKQPVGVRLDGKLWRAYGEESPLGNLLADIVRARTHADLALLNGGGLRADLPAGELRYGALFETLPFANRLATLRLSGAHLRELFARNLTGTGGVLSLGGATVSAQCKDHALSVQITLSNGKLVADTDQISIGTSDFLALGGDDFSRLPPHAAPQIDESGPTLRDVVGAAFKERATIRPDDPAFFDPAHPRLKLPAARPIHCP